MEKKCLQENDDRKKNVCEDIYVKKKMFAEDNFSSPPPPPPLSRKIMVLA